MPQLKASAISVSTLPPAPDTGCAWMGMAVVGLLLWRRKIDPWEEMLLGCTHAIWCSRRAQCPLIPGKSFPRVISAHPAYGQGHLPGSDPNHRQQKAKEVRAEADRGADHLGSSFLCLLPNDLVPLLAQEGLPQASLLHYKIGNN